jgi:hypothetical protein
VLLRLAYLPVTNAFAVPRLLPISDRGEDAEIPTLRLWVPVNHPRSSAGRCGDHSTQHRVEHVQLIF